jgi:hypothetical protein
MSPKNKGTDRDQAGDSLLGRVTQPFKAAARSKVRFVKALVACAALPAVGKTAE